MLLRDFIVAAALVSACAGLSREDDYTFVGNTYCFRRDPPLRHGTSCWTHFECVKQLREMRDRYPGVDCRIVGIGSDVPLWPEGWGD